LDENRLTTEELSALRFKLYEKAKREPGFHPLALQGVSSSCRESRMREICTSGSTGEEWAS